MITPDQYNDYLGNHCEAVNALEELSEFVNSLPNDPSETQPAINSDLVAIMEVVATRLRAAVAATQRVPA